MLGSSKIMAFAATQNPDRARAFYRDILGLKLVGDDSFALVFDANGTMLRVQIVQEVTPYRYTTLGWQVLDIAAVASQLQSAGVQLERFEWFTQDELGIWTSPGGARVGWFKDPDGNLLSVTQF